MDNWQGTGYLRFVWDGVRRWRVLNAHDGRTIGFVDWDKRWGKLSFFPSCGEVLPDVWLREISQFCASDP